METQQHKNNESKRQEAEKLSKMTDEEKDEYFMIEKLLFFLWSKARLEKNMF